MGYRALRGKAVDPAVITAAVNDYLTANPGTGVTPEQVETIVETALAEQPAGGGGASRLQDLTDLDPAGRQVGEFVRMSYPTPSIWGAAVLPTPLPESIDIAETTLTFDVDGVQVTVTTPARSHSLAQLRSDWGSDAYTAEDWWSFGFPWSPIVSAISNALNDAVPGLGLSVSHSSVAGRIIMSTNRIETGSISIVSGSIPELGLTALTKLATGEQKFTLEKALTTSYDVKTLETYDSRGPFTPGQVLTVIADSYRSNMLLGFPMTPTGATTITRANGQVDTWTHDGTTYNTAQAFADAASMAFNWNYGVGVDAASGNVYVSAYGDNPWTMTGFIPDLYWGSEGSTIIGQVVPAFAGATPAAGGGGGGGLDETAVDERVNLLAPGIADSRISAETPNILSAASDNADARINALAPGIADTQITAARPGILSAAETRAQELVDAAGGGGGAGTPAIADTNLAKSLIAGPGYTTSTFAAPGGSQTISAGTNDTISITKGGVTTVYTVPPGTHYMGQVATALSVAMHNAGIRGATTHAWPNFTVRTADTFTINDSPYLTFMTGDVQYRKTYTAAAPEARWATAADHDFHLAGSYYGPYGSSLSSAVTPSNTAMGLWRFFVPQDGWYDRASIVVQTAGAAGDIARIGIFGPLLNGGSVGDLYADLGTVPLNTTGQKEVTCRLWLPRGWYQTGTRFYTAANAPRLLSISSTSTLLQDFPWGIYDTQQIASVNASGIPVSTTAAFADLNAGGLGYNSSATFVTLRKAAS